MRDAPSRQRLYPEALADGRLILTTTKEEATEGADALVICTEWKRYRCADLRLEGPQFRSVGSRPAPQADL